MLEYITRYWRKVWQYYL